MKILLGAMSLLVSGLLAPATTSYATADTCRGIPATLVGSPDVVLDGTAGNDVIVSNGASQVIAGAGDDVVCATGSTRRLDAGPGNDVVDTTATTRYVRTTLGDGDDDFEGGPGRDWVIGGTISATGEKVDTGVDEIFANDGGGRIDTGAGDSENADYASFGTAGPGQSNDIVFEGVQEFSYGDLSFGDGRSRLFLTTIHADTESVGLYAEGSFREDGRQRLAGASADVVYLDYDRLGELEIVGSPADEHVVLRGHSLAHPMVELGGGDDTLDLRQCPRGPGAGVVDGGTGLDTVHVGTSATGCRQVGMVLDGDVTVDGYSVATLRRVDNLTARARRVSLTGNFRDNRLMAYGCRIALRGGAGADGLEAPGRTGCSTIAELAGGPGPDILVGSPGSDLLVGGPNRDVAVGRGGTDACRAEVEKGCER